MFLAIHNKNKAKRYERQLIEIKTTIDTNRICDSKTFPYDYKEQPKLNIPPVRETHFLEIPINFHFVKDSANVNLQLGFAVESLKNLNDAFAPHIHFYLESEYIYFYDDDGNYIEFIHEHYEIERNFVKGKEKEKSINVFFLPTFGNLNGYTKILPQQDAYLYESLTPKYDAVYIAYRDYLNTGTLTHEVGHNFTLPHLMDCRNWMSYDCYRDTFNDEQMEKMLLHIINDRKYLVRSKSISI